MILNYYYYYYYFSLIIIIKIVHAVNNIERKGKENTQLITDKTNNENTNEQGVNQKNDTPASPSIRP